MSKKKQINKSLAERIANDIRRVSEDLKVPVYSLTKAKYFSDAQFSEWELRKVGGFIGIRNAFFEKEEIRNEDEVTDLNNLRKEYRKLRREMGNLNLFQRKIEESVSDIPKIKVRPYKVKRTGKNGDPRTLNLVLSDLHFGSDLTTSIHSKSFGPIEEARALAAIVNNVCKYKLDHRDDTSLVVNILGDIIENELHGKNSSDLLHLQTCRAMYLISQAIARFSENFKKVTVNFSVGNHGRDTSIHSGRATDMKFNALETTIYYGVKLSCSHIKNVDFNLPYTPWVAYEAQGHKVYATHGDTHLNPGNVGARIDIKSLENQINKINASLKNDQEYKVFVVGHVHQAMTTQLPNGAFLIVNGALVPPNDFAQSLNIMESQLIQVMWESTQKQPVGDIRFINVTNSLKNRELDTIIQPFKGIDVS